MRNLFLVIIFTCIFACHKATAQDDNVQNPKTQENPTQDEKTDDATAQRTVVAEQGTDKANTKKDDKLYFAFAGTKWSDVIKWLAESSELALHINELPPGSFTYSDDRGFTTQEAIDRINLFLLPEDFTLVRSGRLLTVINLTDPKSLKQLDTMARLVTVDELDELENHDMVKCIFALKDLETEEAVEELSALNLLKAPDIFSKTNQILITDTAGKLKLAKKILSSFKPDTLDNGTIVRSFKLNHVSAEDVLTVARPHLGLATGEMIGIDVSLSADVLGKNIFVTGIEDKVKLIEGLIKEIDVEEKKLRNQNDVLQSHRVSGGNVEMVYNVLQTMLTGEEIRLSMDKTAQAIVALAPLETQKVIADTVVELQATESEFAVIPLKHIDPYFVIALLEDMLGLDSSGLDSDSSSGFGFERWGGRWGGGWGGFGRGQEEEVSVDPPKIDADPGSKKLFVLGKKYQIEQIKKIVEELDVATTSVDDNSAIRIIPIKGAKAVTAVETAARFWKGENSIIFYPSPTKQSNKPKERVIADEKEEENQDGDNEQQALGAGRILSKKLNTDEPAIQVQVTERGLLLQCEDTEALSKFEEILRTVIGPTDSVVSAPIVYYLKYAKPDEAIRMLAELLDGGEAAKEAESGTLVNGIVSNSSDTFFGSLILSRDGTLTMTFGTITVVADTRLNRLIAQGTVDELEMIESYLKIIDKDKSITEIEIYGSSHVVELEHVDANEVAATLQDAFYGRVQGGTSSNQSRQGSSQRSQGGQPQQGRDPRQQNNDNQNRDGKNNSQGRDGGNQQRPPSSQRSGGSAKNNEPKMTIAVHEPSNSLIITAPDALFKQAEKLAKLIDQRGVQAIEVIQIKRPLANDLRAILNGEIPVPNSGSSSNSNNRSPFNPTRTNSRSNNNRDR